MDAVERINTVLDFKKPDRLPQCNFFTDGFIRSNGGLQKNLYSELGHEIVPLFANINPGVLGINHDEGEDGTFIDGWGRRCRKTPVSGFIEVIEYAMTTLETLPRFEFDSPDLPERYIKPSPGNLHHPGSFSKELKRLAGSAFLCGNVYDPFETLARVIGLKNALMTLKTDPDKLKPVFSKFGTVMKEFGRAQLNYSGGNKLHGIWIWGDIAYTRGLMMAPSTYRELVLPPLKDMISSFIELGAKVIYHTDGNPLEIVPDLVSAGVTALHPVEWVTVTDLRELMTEYHGKISFIGGIPPVNFKDVDPIAELGPVLTELNEIGKHGGLIPGFTNFVNSSTDIKVLDSITNFFTKQGYQ
jgi:hypothetical protein